MSFDSIADRVSALESVSQRRFSRSNPLPKEWIARGHSDGRLLVSSRKHAYAEGQLTEEGINAAFGGIREELTTASERAAAIDERVGQLESAEWPEDHAGAIKRAEAGLDELRDELQQIRDEMDAMRGFMQEPLTPRQMTVGISDIPGLEEALTSLRAKEPPTEPPRSVVIRGSRKGSQGRFQFEPGTLVVEREARYTVFSSKQFALTLLGRSGGRIAGELGAGPCCLTLKPGTYRISGVCKEPKCLKINLHFIS